jgi:hypothetical protein
MYVKPEAYQAHYRRISASKAADMQAQELAASQEQQKQEEMEEARKERKQAEYEHHQYKKLLARHPAPPPPTASLAYNWRSKCDPDGPPLSEDEYQPNYVDPCDPQYRYETRPLSAPVTRPATVKKISSGDGDIQIGYEQAANSGPDAETGC